MSYDKLKRIDEGVRVMWAVFLAFWFAYAIGHTLGGCSDTAKRDISNFFSDVGSCEKKKAAGTLAVAEQEVFKNIQSALNGGVAFDSQQWKDTSLSLAATFGAETIACLSSSLYTELMSVRAARILPLTVRAESYQGYLKTLFTQSAGKVSH